MTCTLCLFVHRLLEVFVLNGGCHDNEAEVIKIFSALGWVFKRFFLSYCLRSMKDAGHFTHMRGIGNAGCSETMFVCWKGNMPKAFPKERLVVDPGSPMYNEISPLLGQTSLLSFLSL